MGCDICDEFFLDHRSLFSHFPGCCRRSSNPDGIFWSSHDNIDKNAIVAREGDQASHNQEAKFDSFW